MSKRPWSPMEDALMRDLYPDCTCADLAALLDRKPGSIYGAATRLGLSKSDTFKASDLSGRIQRGKLDPRMTASRFAKGMTPWNKGMEYLPGGRCAETQFRKGNRPHTWQPVGSYRITADGYLERKMNNLPGANHVRWHGVHRTLWVAAHGPIPEGHIVVFKPGTRTNVLEHITLDKLECISRAENARRNHPGARNPELYALYQLKGAITRQVNKINRNHAESQTP